jgi:hypothetical protein
VATPNYAAWLGGQSARSTSLALPTSLALRSTSLADHLGQTLSPFVLEAQWERAKQRRDSHDRNRFVLSPRHFDWWIADTCFLGQIGGNTAPGFR